MYWLYLILFVLIVLVPTIIRSDFNFIAEEGAEQIAILFIGTMGFLLFLWQERKSILHWKERNKAQRSVNQISKDLVESYSYIGEINRKVDILQEVISDLPEYLNNGKENEREALDEILNSIKLLVGSESFLVYFCDVKTGIAERILGLNSKKSLSKISIRFCPNERKIDRNRVLMVGIPHEIQGIQATLVATRKKNYTPEDITIIKALISLLMMFYLAMHPRSPNN